MTATCRYYLLQASNLSAPSEPTQNPPGGSWSETEPSYTSGSTNTLYFVDLTVFSDGTWSYSAASKSSAYEAAKEAYNKAQAVQEVLKGLTVVDANGVTKVNGGRIDTKSLFAQDITATGTITGAQLIGAILSGGAINIEGAFQGYTGTEKGYLKTEDNGGGIPHLILGMGSASITLEPNGMSDVVIDGSDIYIGAPGKTSSTSVYDLYINGELSGDAKYNTYDSFAGSITSAGSITVTKKFGMCFINGSVTLSAAVSG